MRPIFSPTDFIQIKGRGTRKCNFANKEVLKDKSLIENIAPENLQKSKFKLFDFFANCEFFEEKFNYDEVIKLPPKTSTGEGFGGGGHTPEDDFSSYNPDPLKSMTVNEVGVEGMKIDRMYFDKFEDKVKDDIKIQEMVLRKDFEAIEQYILDNIFDKPNEYYNISKLRNAVKIDRRLPLREIIEKIFGYIPYFKSKDELLEEEFEKFDTRYLPADEYFSFAKDFFKSYITDNEFRDIIENKKYALLNTNPNGDVFRKLSPELRFAIPEYIKDNVSLNKFVA
jgi:type I restriction enzyme R subunit